MEEYDDGEHNKTVYAHFGLAMFLAQCLEHGLVNALVYLDLIPSKAKLARNRDEWAAAVDNFMDRHFEHTLGQMIRDLGRVTSVPQGLETALANALRTRNWLAHDYFRERASEFMTPSGRDQMIAELESAQALFRETDHTLDSTIRPIREKHGFTDEFLKKASDEMLSEVRVKPSKSI